MPMKKPRGKREQERIDLRVKGRARVNRASSWVHDAKPVTPKYFAGAQNLERAEEELTYSRKMRNDGLARLNRNPRAAGRLIKQKLKKVIKKIKGRRKS